MSLAETFACDLAACHALAEEIDEQMRGLIYAEDLEMQYRKGRIYLPLRVLLEKLASEGVITPHRGDVLVSLKNRLEYIRG